MINNPNAEKPVFSLGRRKEAQTVDVQAEKVDAQVDKVAAPPPKKKKKKITFYELRNWIGATRLRSCGPWTVRPRMRRPGSNLS
jgi:hypothetical protein